MLRFLLWLLLLYAVLVLVACSFQDRLLYQPGVGREHVATPDSRGMDWKSVALKTDDDLTLDAWWIPAEKPRGVLLFFHGNAGNISHRLDSIEQFHGMGLSVLIVDYRGYGRSEGSPSEAGTARDARAAWRWLREARNIEAERIVLFGRSLGAAVAAELAHGLVASSPEATPAALILESPFTSVPALAQQLYPFLPVRWLSRFDYSTADYVSQVNVPVLVIHSRDDDIIPFSEGKAVFEAAREPKHMLEIGGSHNTGFLDSERDYLKGIETFLKGPAGLVRDR